MEKWVNDLAEEFFAALETTAEETAEALEAAGEEAEKFFVETADKTFNEFADLSADLLDSVLELMGEVFPIEEIAAEFERAVDEAFDIEFDGDFYRDGGFSRTGFYYSFHSFDELGTYVPPGDRSPCLGCQNYYGYAHNGNLLVCAMHPYGPEGDTCPDRDG